MLRTLISSDSQLVRAPHLAWQLVAGEVVVIDLRSRVTRGLNPLGSAVWQLVDGKRTVADILLQVAKNVGPDAPTLEKDVTTFLEQLQEKGLLQ